MKVKKYPTFRIALAVVLIVCYPSGTFSQVVARNHQKEGPQEKTQVVRLKDALLKLKNDFQVDILFEERLVSGIVVESSQTDFGAPFERNLQSLLRSTGLRYKKIKKDSYMILSPKTGRKTAFVEERPLQQTEAAATETQTNPGQPQPQSAMEKAAQTVSGKVTDENNSGLPGVSVSVKNTTTGTATDASGNYTQRAGRQRGTGVQCHWLHHPRNDRRQPNDHRRTDGP